MNLSLKFVFLEMSSEYKLRSRLPKENFPKKLLLLFSYVTGFLVGFHVIVCTS